MTDSQKSKGDPMAETPSLTRYHIVTDDETGESESFAVRHADGTWCRYSDVAPILERCLKLEAALRDAEPYVAGAYECAFPDAVENEQVLAELRAALSEKGET